MRRAKGSTLIELLVVIAVIALLLAILLPVVQRVRRLAKAAVCRATLRQWALVWEMYTEENNFKFPRYGTQRGGGLTAVDWRAELEGFYSNERVVL